MMSDKDYDRGLLVAQEDWERRSMQALGFINRAIQSEKIDKIDKSWLIVVLMSSNKNIGADIKLVAARELNKRKESGVVISVYDAVNNAITELISNEAVTVAYAVKRDRSEDFEVLFGGDKKTVVLASQLGLTDIYESDFKQLRTLLGYCGKLEGLIRAFWPQQSSNLCNLIAVLAFYQIKNRLRRLLEDADTYFTEILKNQLSGTDINYPDDAWKVENVVNTILGNNDLMPTLGQAIPVGERTHIKKTKES